MKKKRLRHLYGFALHQQVALGCIISLRDAAEKNTVCSNQEIKVSSDQKNEIRSDEKVKFSWDQKNKLSSNLKIFDRQIRRLAREFQVTIY